MDNIVRFITYRTYGTNEWNAILITLYKYDLLKINKLFITQDYFAALCRKCVRFEPYQGTTNMTNKPAPCFSYTNNLSISFVL